MAWNFSVPSHTTFFAGYLDAVGRHYSHDRRLCAIAVGLMPAEFPEHFAIVSAMPVEDMVEDFARGISNFLSASPRDRLVFYLIEYFAWYKQFSNTCACEKVQISGDDFGREHIAYRLSIDHVHEVLFLAYWKDKDPVPNISLRGGAAIDDHRSAPTFDKTVDLPTPEYLEEYSWGIPHLDSESWHYYLPILTEHALRNIATAESNAVDAFLASLRPPDRVPPRFASLNQAQKTAVVAMLDALAFDDSSQWKSQAMLALEEYWGPGALYRARTDDER